MPSFTIIICISRETKEIGGIEIGKKQFKLSLFADDLLLYLSNAVTSVPHVMKIITTFSGISGYKMNIAKTELLFKIMTRIYYTRDKTKQV
uniref:Reverse transcriptase domain-containing protein n=1 Tax=Sander lucioperca TaxID=283035 RepID=A0A8C9Y9R0_SANLU